jgi:hypothetical protein
LPKSDTAPDLGSRYITFALDQRRKVRSVKSDGQAAVREERFSGDIGWAFKLDGDKLFAIQAENADDVKNVRDSQDIIECKRGDPIKRTDYSKTGPKGQLSCTYQLQNDVYTVLAGNRLALSDPGVRTNNQDEIKLKFRLLSGRCEPQSFDEEFKMEFIVMSKRTASTDVRKMVSGSCELVR